MKNEKEKDGERPIDAVLRIFHGYMEPSIKQEFPNLAFREERDMCRFGSCIGFIAGLYYSGQRVMAEQMTTTFMRSFDFARKEDYLLEVGDDGSNLSFSFSLYRKMEEGEMHNRATTIGGRNCRYAPCFYGGIIFHGLQEVFSVSITGESGWSMHT